MPVSLLIFGHLSYTHSPFNLPVALIRFIAHRWRISLLSFCSSVEHPRQPTYSTQRVLISFQPRGYFFRVKIVMGKHRLTNGLRRPGQWRFTAGPVFLFPGEQSLGSISDIRRLCQIYGNNRDICNLSLYPICWSNSFQELQSKQHCKYSSVLGVWLLLSLYLKTLALQN